MRQYYVYIMTNKINTVLYTGVTRDLVGRVRQHKSKLVPGFTSRYNVNKLVYYEQCQYIEDAINREKQLKNWHRQWRFNLIRLNNPNLMDLSNKWY